MENRSDIASASCDKEILEHTEIAAVPLVPEIRLRLLRQRSPLWASFGDGPEAPGVPRPYWAFGWSGGQASARYLLDHPELVRSKWVLDFGAGCGISSIAAALAGARRVTASDIDPLAIAAVGLNARLNQVAVDTLCSDLIYTENPGWEVVLGGDIWYDSRLSRHGQNWLRSLAGAGVLILIGDPGRQYSPSEGLEVLAEYSCRSVPDVEHPNLQKVSVYRLLGDPGFRPGPNTRFS
jgi:predicted nicotinamide N-methyase